MDVVKYMLYSRKKTNPKFPVIFENLISNNFVNFVLHLSIFFHQNIKIKKHGCYINCTEQI